MDNFARVLYLGNGYWLITTLLNFGSNLNKSFQHIIYWICKASQVIPIHSIILPPNLYASLESAP